MSQNQAVVIQSLGGSKSALNVHTDGAIIKGSLGTLFRIKVEAVPSAGALVINDLAAATGYTAGNQIGTWDHTVLTAGQVITLEWPCLTGIVVQTVGTGGVYSISYS